MQSESEESSFYSSSECGSSGNERIKKATNSWKKDVDEMIEQINNFQPYMYGPERVVSNTILFDEESTNSETDTEDSVATRIGNVKWCKCQNWKKKQEKLTVCVV